MSLRASHILIKHEGSRNPVSRRTGESTKTRTRASAEAELSEVRDAIVAGKVSFEDEAQRLSDCGSFKSGGDLGVFGAGDMMKPFEDAVRGIEVGQVSGLVETDSGTHIIKRLPV